MTGILNRYEESDRGRDFKLRPRRSLAPVGREGKGQGYEAETQEVQKEAGF